jgi:hypothetical protein
MKQLIINLVAIIIIGMGGFYLTTSANTLPSVNTLGGICTDAGCKGGDLKCYEKDGGTCYTNDDPDPIIIIIV